jgi:hypothetical protein
VPQLASRGAYDDDARDNNVIDSLSVKRTFYRIDFCLFNVAFDDQ